MSSPTHPSTHNGGSNFNATGNARDHGIGRQSPSSFRPGLTDMSSGMSQGVAYREIPGYIPQFNNHLLEVPNSHLEGGFRQG